VVGRWRRRHGRPLACSSDRHRLFEPQDTGPARPEAATPFGRALRALGLELIRVPSPQAKGRVQRSLATAPDRWVQERRRAGATTEAEANAVRERRLPAHHRRCAQAA
jgi:hypothetical protein